MIKGLFYHFDTKKVLEYGNFRWKSVKLYISKMSNPSEQDSFGILPNVGGRPPYSQNLSFLAVLGGLLVMMAFIIRMLYQVNLK